MIMTNRKLTRSFDSVKKIFLKIVIGVVLVCILFVCFLYTNNEIGVTSSKLEADIRSSQKIKDDWTVDGSVSSTMAAYISYPQDLSDHSFSVYVNRPGLSFGYFFRGGGTLSGIQRGIVEFTVEGYNERAFISMNQQQVTQLEIDDGNTIQVLDIDSNKPFAIVLPINAGNITFYDVIEIIYVFLTIFLYLLKCPQSLILSALRAFCFCGKPHISRSIFLYFRYQAWLKSW